MSPRKKFRRSNLERRKNAEKLLRVWYSDLSAEGATTYRQGGQKVAVAVPANLKGYTLAQARKDRPEHFRPRRVKDETGQVVTAALSADGKDRRYVFVDDDYDMPIDHGRDDVIDVRVRGDMGLPGRPTEVPDGRPYELYARETMRHVAMICREDHMALEMAAAGWSFEAIAEEIGCGEPTARQLYESGLSSIMNYQALVKPSRMYMDESG